MNLAVFGMLYGEWRFARDIQPDGASVRGEAAFIPDDADALAYTESGLLLLPGGSSFTAVRRYRYRAEAAGLHVDFADGPDTGRPFVLLCFASGAGGWAEASAVHPCRADTYRVHMRVRPDAIVTTIAVAGPAKNYVATTHFARPSTD